MSVRKDPQTVRPEVCGAPSVPSLPIGIPIAPTAVPSTARMRPDEAEIAAPWSAPLLKDILVVESQGEDLDVAALGVRVALLALLDNYTVPGWLPALLDEQRCPLSGPMSPTPSWCFKKDHGAVPIGVVRLNARCHRLILASTTDLPNCSLRLRTCNRRCINTSCSSSSVSA